MACLGASSSSHKKMVARWDKTQVPQFTHSLHPQSHFGLLVLSEFCGGVLIDQIQ